jgi:arylsulfatase A
MASHKNHCSRRDFLKAAGAIGVTLLPARKISMPALRPSRRPNIVFILGDDLGYAELGCYGQQKIRTPNIDKLAGEGIRFTQNYSGSPVCAPSRCVLLTGLHSGHAFIRDNREVQPEGQLPIPAGTVTLPELLKEEGYSTAAIGKWGLGFPGSEGEPNKQGFDLFFGYNCQRHAHNYYPKYLWRNGRTVTLEGNDAGLTGKQYAPDLFEAEVLDFIRSHKDRPFFLHFVTTVPHLALQVPEDSLEEYKGKWEDPPYDGKNGYLPQKYPRAAYAAMVTRMDRSVGRIMALLRQLGLDGDTIVMVSSDNGSTYKIGGYDPDFFKGTGPFRNSKGSLYEGGIRVPLIVRWVGRIKPGRTTDHVASLQDVLPTLLEAVGAARRIPAGIDGLSFLPTLLGSGKQPEHEYLYMEFPAYGGQQMVRLGNWKGIRQDLLKNPDAPIELYDLAVDIGEQNNLAQKHPALVENIRRIMRSARRPSKEFPFPALDNQAVDTENE